jgi:hypothetical protein
VNFYISSFIGIKYFRFHRAGCVVWSIAALSVKPTMREVSVLGAA